MKIVKNDYTINANPRRGYHDSELIVEWEGEDLAAREAYRDAKLADLGTPFNMWCRLREFNETRMVINYGFDSGD